MLRPIEHIKPLDRSILGVYKVAIGTVPGVRGKSAMAGNDEQPKLTGAGRAVSRTV